MAYGVGRRPLRLHRLLRLDLLLLLLGRLGRLGRDPGAEGAVGVEVRLGQDEVRGKQRWE